MHALLGGVRQALQKLGWEGSGTLVAISGGPDSVALLRVMHILTQDSSSPLLAAHFNHRLRGAQSDADEHFVRSLCEQLGIPLVVGYPSTPIERKAGGGSLEHAARIQRYRFLVRTASYYQIRYVLTAHTGDDQAETILFRILRGTGLRGLCGIPAKRVLAEGIVVLRPMLEVTREEVLDFLKSAHQEFREDQSNWDPRFVRNRIRHELLPLLERQYRPNVRQSLIRLGLLARGLYEFLQPIIEQNAEAAAISCGFDHLRLNTCQLNQLPDFLLGEVLQYLWERQGWPLGEMSQSHWQRLMALVRRAAAESNSSLPNSPLSPSQPQTPEVPPLAESIPPSNSAGKNWAPPADNPGLSVVEGKGTVRNHSTVPSRQVFPGNILAEIQAAILELRLR
jgi:tRNA(Ile)-lysidine synthase